MKYLYFHFFNFILLLFIGLHSHAYSDFISYGYTTCMNCHFNGAGGGPLTDYGRGVFASEIAAKPFWNPTTTDDSLSESSGFFGRRNLLGENLRPGIKTRHLAFITNPGTDQSIKRTVFMQGDINLAFLPDPDQKLIFVGTIGLAPIPRNNDGSAAQRSQIISREHYVRWEFKPQSWIYAGFLDKTFGIRTPDHTAFSRSGIGLGQNDQAHSVILQLSREQHELFMDLFFGHLGQQENLRQRGLSSLYEFQIYEKMRIGAGLLFSKNSFIQQSRIEGHTRIGINPGVSVLAEFGLLDDLILSSHKNTQGLYGFLQSMARLQRGWNLLTVFQIKKDDLAGKQPEQMQFSLGLLIHPAQRFEWRFDVINSKSLNPDIVAESNWALQSQLHVSL